MSPVGIFLFVLLLAVFPARADWHTTSSKILGSPQPGISVVESQCSNSDQGEQVARVVSVSFDERKHTLRVIDSPSPGEASLASVMKDGGFVAGVNGGYFHQDLRPVGLVIADGKMLHPFERAKLLSGFVAVSKKGEISIQRSGKFNTKTTYQQALQCGPMLIENAAPVLGLESKRLARRTAIATGPSGRRALIYISSVTLSDAARILALPGIFGDWKPETALNLDGGTSSGLWAADIVSLPEIKLVRNFIGVVPK
jgi:uncharacterized protein YigE (DUF2233 family)